MYFGGKEHICLKTLSPGLICGGFSEEDLCGGSCPSPTYVPSGFVPVTHTSQTLKCLHHISVWRIYFGARNLLYQCSADTSNARELMPDD